MLWILNIDSGILFSGVAILAFYAVSAFQIKTLLLDLFKFDFVVLVLWHCAIKWSMLTSLYGFALDRVHELPSWFILNDEKVFTLVMFYPSTKQNEPKEWYVW